MNDGKCVFHDELVRELRENNKSLRELLEKLQGEGGISNRLSILETKVGNKSWLLGACGLVVIGRIVYDFVAGS